ncbi:MAG: hypothetical protein LUD50_03230 [Clostridia bacterium]|nr:hypothetical protein [Clostridia bacterium]
MGHLKISVRLDTMRGAGVSVTESGKHLLVIDLSNAQGIKAGKKGVYMNLIAFENKNGVNRFGHTHFIKPSQSKEERANEDAPIIGNLGPLVAEPEPVRMIESGVTDADLQNMAAESGEDDDLPF